MQQATRGGPTNLSLHINLEDDTDESSDAEVPDYASMAAGCCIPLLATDGEEGEDPWADFKPTSAKLSFSTLRLFESEWFNMSMAVAYLHQYPDEDVQRYLCMRMKAFDSQTIEFWMPQIIALYLNQSLSAKKVDLARDSHLFNWIVNRCTRYVKFSLVTWWWLTSHVSFLGDDDMEQKLTRKLLQRIEQSHPRFPIPLDDGDLELPTARRVKGANVGHRRTRSSGALSSLLEAFPEEPAAGKFGTLPSAAKDLSAARRRSGAWLDTGTAFDWPALPRSQSSLAVSALTDLNNVPRSPGHASSGPARTPSAPAPNSGILLGQCMRAQQNFVSALVNIAGKLVQYETKDVKKTQLFAELALINLNLPARVYIPLRVGGNAGPAPGARTQEHHVVRFPPQEATILNSRDRVPYMLFVEVLDCEHCQTSALPEKLRVPQQRPPSAEPKSGTPGRRASGGGDEGGDEGGAAPESCAAESDAAEKNGVVEANDIRRSLMKASQVRKFEDRNDPSARAAKEPWDAKLERIQQSSPYGHLPNWRLVPVIVKAGDDLRQELLASQLMSAFQSAWTAEKVKLWVRPLQILVTRGDGGLIEVVGSAVSVHQIKKHNSSLAEYFKTEFGSPTSEAFMKAQQNFAESLAGYCLFCYFIQVRDRHNSNIMIDGDGHILHIDFGYMLSTSNSPGKGMNFEKAPFKLTYELIEVLGGPDSDMMKYFRILILKGFMAARKHMKSLIPIVELMIARSQLPCLESGPAVLEEFEDRFKLAMTEEQLSEYVDMLVDTSLESIRTALYDRFQYYSNGIL